MKILVIGDIHGKTCWEDIVAFHGADKIIFLGDYVSTHGDETAKQQIDNLRTILDWAETANKSKENVILLRGNHDMQHLGYSWAECSGWNRHVYEDMKNLKERFLKSTKWVHLENIDGKKYIFSHAGISKVWLSEVLSRDKNILEEPDWIERINEIEPDERFGFWPCRFSDYTGESETQPPTWIRPYMLARTGIEGYNQVVGHTPVTTKCLNLYEMVPGAFETPFDLWLCDALDVGSYITIEDNNVKVHNINEL